MEQATHDTSTVDTAAYPEAPPEAQPENHRFLSRSFVVGALAATALSLSGCLGGHKEDKSPQPSTTTEATLPAPAPTTTQEIPPPPAPSVRPEFNKRERKKLAEQAKRVEEERAARRRERAHIPPPSRPAPVIPNPGEGASPATPVTPHQTPSRPTVPSHPAPAPHHHPAEKPKAAPTHAPPAESHPKKHSSNSSHPSHPSHPAHPRPPAHPAPPKPKHNPSEGKPPKHDHHPAPPPSQPPGSPAPAPNPGPESTPPPTPVHTPGSTQQPNTRAHKLAIGYTEPNPHLTLPPDPLMPVMIPEQFTRWSQEVDKIQPHFVRILLNWAELEPTPGAPLDLDHQKYGSMREIEPHAPYSLRDQLAALAIQEARYGTQAIVSIYDTPEWAAQAPHGCEAEGIGPGQRAPRPEALGAYEDFVHKILAAAEAMNVKLTWWNAWNEPNHPYFLSPQREVCDKNAPSVAVESYLHLNNALQHALDSAPGNGQYWILLGDVAGIPESNTKATSTQEFIEDLPKKVVCKYTVWAQHGYYAERDDAKVAVGELNKFDCETPRIVWITETGIGKDDEDLDPIHRCNLMYDRLKDWYANPQVSVAIQYTIRADNRFNYGVISSDLSQAFPVLGLWQALGGQARPDPTDPLPPKNEACKVNPAFAPVVAP
jgi:hypothetical protein